MMVSQYEYENTVNNHAVKILVLTSTLWHKYERAWNKNEVFRTWALPGTKVRGMIRGREDREDRKGLKDNVQSLIQSNTREKNKNFPCFECSSTMLHGIYFGTKL